MVTGGVDESQGVFVDKIKTSPVTLVMRGYPEDLRTLW